MKKYFILAFLLFLMQPAFADDSEIYGVSAIDVKPNVLIVFDNSGSMGFVDLPTDIYDPDVIYPGTYPPNNVYRGGSSPISTTMNLSTHSWECSSAKTALMTEGFWAGWIYLSGTIVKCSTYNVRPFYSGNFLNFNAQASLPGERIIVAKSIIAELIDEFSDDINFGLMRFHYRATASWPRGDGGELVAACGTSTATLIGESYDSTATFTTGVDSSYGAIGSLTPEYGTPLAEAMAEAGQYFAGEKGWFDHTATKYTSPITERCQKNFIILITDGEPSEDDGKIASTIYLNGITIPSLGHDGKGDDDGDNGSNGDSYLDDVSYFLANQDLRPDLGVAGDFPDQMVSTHTIGIFGQTSVPGSLSFLQAVAANGNGTFSNATSSETLKAALKTVFQVIAQSNEQFSASAVPVSSDDGFTAGDYVYFGLFQPLTGGPWAGNLKKYSLGNGVIKDKNNNDALLGNGSFSDNSISYWGTEADGNSVTAGGAGAILDAASTRSIYTYTGSNASLTHPSNTFVTTNPALVPANFSDLTDSVITAVRHDAADDTSWPLGSFIHSEPLVIHYGTTQTMIYIGANDGMLHCFDDEDGSEEWGFIPRDLLDGLSVLESPTQLYYFVDGSPTVFTYDDSGSEKKILIFGERRGGSSYTALDVSVPSSPNFMYSIESNFLTTNDTDIVLANRETLGQSWGKPQNCRMYDSSAGKVKDVFLLSGGYDINEDTKPVVADDTVGRAVFAVDSKTGSLLPGFDFNHGHFDAMTHAIVAAAAFENPDSRTSTRIYAGDLGGNLFAARDDDDDGNEDGVWQQEMKLFSSSGKKIFYPPNITNEYYFVKDPTDPEQKIRVKGDYVFYGTGDRAHPTRKDVKNDFYAIKNSWHWEGGTPVIVKAYVDSSDGKIKMMGTSTVIDDEGDGDDGDDDDVLFILNVTDDLYQNTETNDDTKTLYTNYIKSAINNSNNRGWYFELLEDNGDTAGEKIVSSPIIFNGAVYFTTYVPDDGTCDTDDPCANPGASGTGYIYAVGYKYGESVMNLDRDTDGKLTKSDRRLALKTTGIPPEPRVVTPKSGDPYLMAGKEKLDLPPLRGVHLFYWRQLNN